MSSVFAVHVRVRIVHRYTFGKDVEGTVKITATVHPWYSWRQPTQPTIVKTMKVTVITSTSVINPVCIVSIMRCSYLFSVHPGSVWEVTNW